MSSIPPPLFSNRFKLILSRRFNQVSDTTAKKLTQLSLLAILALLLVACGGGGSSSSGGSGSGVVGGGGGNVPKPANNSGSPTSPEIVDISSVEARTANLDWTQAIDDGTSGSDIRYQVHSSNTPNFSPSAATLRQEVTGELSATLSNLPTTLTYFVVRALDSANNASLSSEKSIIVSRGGLQTTTATVKPFETVVPQGSTIDSLGQVNVTAQAEIDDIIVSSASGGTLVKIDSINGRVAQTTAAVLTDVFTNLSFNSKTKLLDNEDIAGSNSQSQPASIARTAANQFQQVHRWPKSGLQIITDNSNAQHPIQRYFQYQASQPSFTPQSAVSYDTGEVIFYVDRVYAIKPGDTLTADIQIVAKEGYSFNGVSIDDTDGPESIDPSSYTLEEKDGGEAGKNKEYRLTWPTHAEHQSQTPYVFTVRADTNCIWCFDDTFDIVVYVDQSGEEELVGKKVNRKIIDHPNLSFTTKGGINFDPDFDIQVELDAAKVKRAEVSISGTLGLDIEMLLAAQRSAESTASKTLYSKSFIKIVTAGPVPIVITGKVSLDAKAKAKAEGELSISQKFTNSYETSFGIRYENDDWHEFATNDHQRRYTFDASAAANVESELRIVPRIDVEFYRVVGFSGSTEPYLYGDGSLEGAFTAIDDAEFQSADANYQFTKLEAGMGLDIKARADFGLIFEKKTLGFCWPTCDDREQLETLYSLPKLKFVSLPRLDIAASGDLRNGGLNLSVNETAGSWFKGTNGLENGFWKVVPSKGLSIQSENNFKQATLNITGTPFNAEHTVYFTGYSRFGTLVRQYATLSVDVSANTVTPPAINAPTNLQATAGSSEVTLSWSTPTNANYLEIYRDSDSNGNQRDRIASPLVSAGNTYRDIGLAVNTRYYYWLKACQTGGQCSEFSTAVSAQTGAATILFQENYESYSTGSLPSDYVIVYNGSGNSQQYVAEDNGNKYLRTSGQSYWGLAMRKDFDTDFPDKVEVTFKMKAVRDGSNYSYSNSWLGNYSHLASFSVKNADEIGIGIGLNKLQSDGQLYFTCNDHNSSGTSATAANKKVISLGEWIEGRLVIDFSTRKYSAYANGTLVCANFNMFQANLDYTWNSWGESAGFNFGSGNSQSTESHFDDIVIKSVENSSNQNPPFVLSKNKIDATGYETTNASIQCKADWGSDYDVASWESIKQFYEGASAQKRQEFLDSGVFGYVTRNGSEIWTGRRHYFTSRHDGNKPSHYLAHDHIDNYTISLGSWYGNSYAVCAK